MKRGVKVAVGIIIVLIAICVGICGMIIQKKNRSRQLEAAAKAASAQEEIDKELQAPVVVEEPEIAPKTEMDTQEVTELPQVEEKVIESDGEVQIAGVSPEGSTSGTTQVINGSSSTTGGTTTGNGSGHKVAIDPGHQAHGNSEQEPIGPGASETKPKVSSGTYGPASGLNEYELNLTVSLKLRDELVARGYEVYMTRETHDVDLSNQERATLAAQSGAEILVRIHANGDDDSSVAGALTMSPAQDNPYLSADLINRSSLLSQLMIDNFCASTGAQNRGVLEYNTMSGINWSQIPVTIVEMGFMTNAQEDLNMASDSYQSLMVQGMANGIDQYFQS